MRRTTSKPRNCLTGTRSLAPCSVALTSDPGTKATRSLPPTQRRRRASAAPPRTLPQQLQSQLDLPRAGLQSGDLPGEVDWRAFSIEQLVVGERRREVRAIRNIERLRAELKADCFGNLYVLEQRNVRR